MKISFKEIAIILLLAIISGTVFNSVSASGVEYIYRAPAITNNTIISLYEMKNIVEKKAALVIDARPKSQFTRGHLPGANNVPYNAKNKEELMDGIGFDEAIVVYCYSKRCNQARRLADALKKLGYKRVALFEDGIVEWKKAKYPVVTF
jgi:rhodanese-related sulfurtransferase